MRRISAKGVAYNAPALVRMSCCHDTFFIVACELCSRRCDSPLESREVVKGKDSAHLGAVAFQGIAVFFVGLAISLRAPEIAESVLMSGAIMVLANAWFAWTVRKIDDPQRILVLHLIRFGSYGIGIALVIWVRQLNVIACVATMIAAHLVYVVATFKNGLIEKPAQEPTK